MTALTFAGPDRRESERRAAASATEFARGQKFGRHEADEEVQRLKAQLAAITSAFDRLNAHAKANPLGDAVNDLLLDVYSPVHLWPAACRAEAFQARVERLTAERDARQWQSLDTAPKDGEVLLLTNGKDVVACYWGLHPSTTSGVSDTQFPWEAFDPTNPGAQAYMECWPTHWMPLPAVPAAALASIKQGGAE